METTAKKQKQVRYFPADELEIPLSIYVPDSYRTPNGHLDSSYSIDRHHRFAPRKDLIHHHGSMGKVLRYSCLQIVPKELHTNFNKYYDKPRLPESQAARFGALLLSIARYLPEEAIDVSQDNPVRRELELGERQQIWSNNELRPEQGAKVQTEILKYITSRRIEGLDEGLVEEFLTTFNDEIKIERGKQLFRLAAEVAVEPVEQAYIDAWEGKLLPRQDIRPENGKLFDITQARAVPKKPAMFVMRHLIKNRYVFNRALDQLHINLSEQYEAA